MKTALTLKPIEIIAVPADEKYKERSFEIEIKVKDDEDYGTDNLKSMGEPMLDLFARTLIFGFGTQEYSILETDAANFIVFDCKLAGISQRRYATIIDGKMIYFIGKDIGGTGITEECYKDLEEIAASLKLGDS